MGPLLAEIGYGRVDGVQRRLRPVQQVAATGTPPGVIVDDWPVQWVDGLRVLDVDGRIELLPGEGLLLGVEPGVPRWWIDGPDLAARFTRAVELRRAIVVDDRDRADKCLTRQDSRCIPPRGSPA
jgi:hypothetical protein